MMDSRGRTCVVLCNVLTCVSWRYFCENETEAAVPLLRCTFEVRLIDGKYIGTATTYGGAGNVGGDFETLVFGEVIVLVFGG